MPTSHDNPLIRPLLILLMLLACTASAESFVKEPFPGGGPGYCDADGRFCDNQGCRPTTAPISQVACRCSLIDPACGLGHCSWIQPSSWIEGSHCATPHALSPSHPASMVLCNGAGLNSTCGLDCTPPPPQMRAWWTMDRIPGASHVALDIKRGNHGILQNGALHSQGMVSDAVYFDGSDDQIYAPQAQGSPDHSYDNLTIDAWIRPDSAQPSAFQRIVEWGGPSAGAWYYSFFVIEDELGFAFCDNQHCFDLRSTGANILPGQWQLVAVVFDLPNLLVKFYVDGQFVSARTWNGTQVLLPGVGNSWTLGERFHGAIDEVEIFERILSTTEIRAIYEAGSAGKCKPQP